MNENECAELSFGLWKIESCALFPDRDDDYGDDHDRKKRGFNWNHDKWHKKCYGNGYKDKEITSPQSMSDKMKPIKQMNQHVGVSMQMGLTEYQVETVVGLGAAVLGLVSAVMYVRTGARKSSLGVVSCLCLLTSGVLYWTAIGKIHTTLSQLRALITVLKMAPVKIPTPWCLVVGGIAATIELLSGILAMIVLSKNSQEEKTTCCHCNSFANPATAGPSSGQEAPTTNSDVMSGKMAYVLPDYEQDMSPPPYDEKMSKEQEAGLPSDKF
ncbi:hypothetical protein KUTeg_009223 [Tegillarca granosa]|uniref:Transmembrane protein n=1 Tax=Tegillarca granosa TaxID=220873 RepID=A0ABQ9FAC8_TEGGR|nr:hypothetical protein KUTeg_009223 [Tegillarca granosa]